MPELSIPAISGSPLLAEDLLVVLRLPRAEPVVFLADALLERFGAADFLVVE